MTFLPQNKRWFHLGVLCAQGYRYYINTGDTDYTSARAFITGRDDVQVSSSRNGIMHLVRCHKGSESFDFTVVRCPEAPGKPLGDIAMPKVPVGWYPSMAMKWYIVGTYYENILGSFPCVHFPHSCGQDGPVFFGKIEDLLEALPQVYLEYKGGARVFVCGRSTSFIFYSTYRTPDEAMGEIMVVLRHLYHRRSVDMRDGVHEAPYTDWLKLCAKNFADMKEELEAALTLTEMKRSPSPTKSKKKTLKAKKASKKPRGHYIGTSWHKKSGRYESKIKVNGTVHYLGYHEKAADGGRAYDKFVRDHNLKRRTNFAV